MNDLYDSPESSTGVRREALSRRFDAELGEAFGDVEVQQLEARVAAALGAPEARGRRWSVHWLLAAVLLSAVGVAVAMLEEPDGGGRAALPPQDPGAPITLEALRADVAAQEHAAMVVAYAFEMRAAAGEGKDEPTTYSMRGNVVMETKKLGRLHVWLAERIMPWTDGPTPFHRDVTQYVFDGKFSISFTEETGFEEPLKTHPEIRIDDGRDWTSGMACSAGAAFTWWSTRLEYPRISELLRVAREDGLRVDGDRAVITVRHGRGTHYQLTFERRERGFALREWRRSRNGGVSVRRFDEFVLVGDRVWFPTRMHYEEPSSQSERHQEWVFRDLQLDPELHDNTFAVVASTRLTSITYGDECHWLGNNESGVFARIRVLSDACTAPIPPQLKPQPQSPRQPR